MSGLGKEQMPPEPEDLDQVAAAWFHRLRDAGAEDAAEVKRTFQRWLEADPDHADAFARTCEVWEALGEHASAPEMVTLRQAALADARAAAKNRWRPAALSRRRSWPQAIAASFATMLAVGAGVYFLMRPAPPQIYATEIGQREAVTLSDNSRVDIDADSRISVDFTEDRRLVHILSGQAYFEVAKDPARPFIVESGGRRVIATGTQFDVEALKNGLRVTLVEGHVTVGLDPDRGGVSQPLADLSPGDELVAEAGRPTRITHNVNTLAVMTWRTGKLLFDGEPLADAVARMKRYSHFELVVDPSVAKLRISGVFNAGDIAAFVDALEAYYPVKGISEGPNAMRLTRRGKK